MFLQNPGSATVSPYPIKHPAFIKLFNKKDLSEATLSSDSFLTTFFRTHLQILLIKIHYNYLPTI